MIEVGQKRFWKDFPDEIFTVASSNRVMSMIINTGNDERRLVHTSLLLKESIILEDK